MDYSKLKRELLLHLRGQLAQSQVNRKLGVSFNKTYRWESGTAHLMWPDFITLTQVLQIPIQNIFRESFSYADDPQNSKLLLKHFVGGSSQAEIAKVLKTSRYTVSRWLQGKSAPTIEQMFALMDFATPDFLRFLEILTEGVVLPSSTERFRQYSSQMNLYRLYPWLSVLLSALDVEGYKKNPTEKFLADKTSLPMSEIKNALRDFADSGLIRWNGKYWEVCLNRIALKATAEDRLNLARYVFQTSLQAVEASSGNKNMRLSWKIFSLNKEAYEKILQRYTEFFNDVGKIIDTHQKDADKIYLFSAGLIDYDQLGLKRPAKENSK